MAHSRTGPLAGAFFVSVFLFQAPVPSQAGGGGIPARHYDRLQVGPGEGNKIVVPSNQVLEPAGRPVTFSGRPTDLALSPDGRYVFTADANSDTVSVIEDLGAGSGN